MLYFVRIIDIKKCNRKFLKGQHSVCFLKRKNWSSLFFIDFSSPTRDGMLLSSGIRHCTEQQKNLEFEGKEKEVWKESEEEDGAE